MHRPPHPAPLVVTAWRSLVGPDATVGENVGTAALTLAGAAAGALVTVRGRRLAPRAAMAVIGADLLVGAGCNHTRAALRWYGSPKRPAWLHAAFPAAHLHPFAVAALLGTSQRRAAGTYLSMLAATALVRASPPGLRRPVAAVCAVAAWAATSRPGAPGSRQEVPGWVLATYWIKLVTGHATA